MGFLKFAFGVGKYNADPAQQKLAQMIIDAVEGTERPAKILDYVLSQGWSRSDQGNRLTHALSMVKVFRADLYPEAKKMCHDIYVVL